MKDGYEIKGKGIRTTVGVAPGRQHYWLEPGELVSKVEAAGLKKYRFSAYQLRRRAVAKGLLVDVGDYFLVKELMVFDSVSSLTSFVLGSSRSGEVATKKRRTLTGRNLLPQVAI